MMQQDNSSSVAVKKDQKITDQTQSLLSLHQQHRAAMSSIFDSDSGNLGLGHVAPVSSLACGADEMTFSKMLDTDLSGRSHSLAAKATGSGSSSSKAKANAATAAIAAMPPSQFPALDKCLKGCRDPIIAGPKIRKATLKDFSVLEARMERAVEVCKEALNYIQDDFDSEDCCRKFDLDIFFRILFQEND